MKLTDTSITEICDLYKTGLSCLTLGKKYNVSGQSIRKHLINRNITLRLPYKEKVNKEDVISAYLRGESGLGIAKKHNVNFGTIYKILEKVKKRPYESNRTHKLDESFFSEWSQRMAYWLGMLCADGNISNNIIRLGLKESDKLHLIKFRDVLLSDYEPRLYKRNKKSFSPGTSYWRISISSKILCEQLVSLGFREFKYGNPQLVNSIPDEYFSHWLRGMSDGDGTVCFVKSVYPAWRLVDCHKGILENISKRLTTTLKLTKMNVYKSKTIWVITAKRRKGLTIMDFLYKDNCESLDRKRLIYEVISSKYR